MKKLLIAAAATMLVASPASALRVTNLDEVTHRVELYGRGEAIVQEIEPGATEYFTGSTQGLLSLVDAPETAKANAGKKHAARDGDSALHADGLLSGVIGAARTSGIPTDPDSSYVIWPGGRLMLQSRIKDNRGR